MREKRHGEGQRTEEEGGIRERREGIAVETAETVLDRGGRQKVSGSGGA